MRTLTGSIRTNYLSGDVEPKLRATIRRMRLDFGGELNVSNDNTVMATPDYAGDDFYDENAPVIWGDSCVSTQSVASYIKFRAVCRAAYLSTGYDNDMYVSRAIAPTNSWALSLVSLPENCLAGTRIGVHPKDDEVDELYYIWHTDASGNLVRRVLDYNGGSWNWISATTDLTLPTWSGLAIHPISEDEAILVGYDDPAIWVKYVIWDEVDEWDLCDYGQMFYVPHLSDNMVWQDAHWSDAEYVPGSSDRICIAITTTRWGTAHSLIFDKNAWVFSQPREIIASSEEWGNVRARVSGLSEMNSRLWAVVTREPVAYGSVNMAHHVALMSSADGIKWRDEDFVTVSPLRGKLLYLADRTYCYVVGNTGVARASATYKLGSDMTAMKNVLYEVNSVNYQVAGPGSAATINIEASNADEGTLDTDLVEPENEVEIEYGDGTNIDTYATALVSSTLRRQTLQEDSFTIPMMGKMSRVTGDRSYIPVAARVYDGPYSLHSNFSYDDGNPRLTMRAVTGVWTTEEDASAAPNKNVLVCEDGGIAVIPQTIYSQNFIFRIAWKARGSFHGNTAVFFYEDEDNFWEAGPRLGNAGVHILGIWRTINGVRSLMCTAKPLNLTTDSWYTLYVEVRPQRIRVFMKASDSYDFSTGTSWVVCYPYSTTTGYPSGGSYVGLNVDALEIGTLAGWLASGASGSGLASGVSGGTVDGAESITLIDLGASFTSADLGKYIRTENERRKIVRINSATSVLLDNWWAAAPASGDPYAIEGDGETQIAGAVYKEIWYCDGMIPWTIDDIVGDIIEMSGCDITEEYDGTIGTLSASSPVRRDIDVKMNTANSTNRIALWTSTTDTSGATAYSGLKVEEAVYYSKLTSVESDGVSGQTETVIARHPNMVPTLFLGAGSNRDIHFHCTQDYIAVSCNGHFLTAFPATELSVGGHIAKITSGTVTATEFCQPQDSFLWDANEKAASALQRLLKGRNVKLIERSDGSISYSRFETALGDAGDYDITMVETNDLQDGAFSTSLVELVGAEESAFHIDIESARRALKYARIDNPTIDTMQEALVEAVNVLEREKQSYERVATMLYAPDPALELEDVFGITGRAESYVVDSIQTEFRRDERSMTFASTVGARSAPEAIDTGTWGPDASAPEYDSGKEYG